MIKSGGLVTPPVKRGFLNATFGLVLRSGYTLIELLVVIAIIAVLIGLLLPAVQKVRSAVARTNCANQMRQLGLAAHQYDGARKTLPPGMTFHSDGGRFVFMNWHTRLLPYVEQDQLWRQAKDAYARQPVFGYNPPHTLLNTVVPIFTCPVDELAQSVQMTGYGKPVAMTSYLGVNGTDLFAQNGVLFVDSKIRLSYISDGTSNTIMVGERPAPPPFKFGWWYAGVGQEDTGSLDGTLGVRELKRTGDLIYGPCSDGPFHFQDSTEGDPCGTFHFWSYHSGGANFLFADGSVRFLDYDADPILPALATRRGGEVVEDS